MLELLATVVLVGVLTLAVWAYVSNYTAWGRRTVDARTVVLLNDALTRFKHLAPPEQFAVLNASGSYAGTIHTLKWTVTTSTSHNQAVVEALCNGYEDHATGIFNKFAVLPVNMDFSQLTSSGTGDDFWFSAYTQGGNSGYPTNATINALVGVQYTYNIPADRNSGTLLFAFTNGTVPAAFNMLVDGNPVGQHGSLGVITFTPTQIGTFYFPIIITQGGQTFLRNITLNVLTGPPVFTLADRTTLLSSPDARNGVTGEVFNYPIYVKDPTDVTYNATNLPTGLSLSGSVISGFPVPGGPGPGPWHPSVGISATNAAGTTPLTLNLTLSLGPPVITSVAYATAEVGHYFSFQILATNSPIGYVIDPSYPLPTGFHMDEPTGLITCDWATWSGANPGGPPPTPWTFHVSAYNGLPGSEQTFSLTIINPPDMVINVLPSS